MAEDEKTAVLPENEVLKRLAPQTPTEFSGILRLLQQTSFADTARLRELEQQTYNLLKNEPQNTGGLIVLMQIEIMLGNAQKAKAVAYRIWEIGGSLAAAFEQVYINGLLNLGLIEMASVLLKPYFENLPSYLKEHYLLFYKYALLSGNLTLLERITLLLPESGIRNAFYDFIGVYRFLNYAEAFRNIMRVVLESVKDMVCAFDFALYTDRGFTDVEIRIFTGSSLHDGKGLQETIALQMASACAAKNTQVLNNLGFVVCDIAEHRGLMPQNPLA